ncbi:DUF4189 domain-containing protein [Xanthomonas graminis]|uniref:DUF4189 domain-containing protein n=1 Tax=Xanthomonas graminis TaxID=3390026 RepID=UPI00210AADF1|nr:DUF4189 domain-containing protein [Xanthomonas translucens]
MNFIKCKIILLFIGFFIFSNSSFAQTRCPVGVQTGSVQCLPDDQGAAPPRPTGEWIKTWGSIATSPSGKSGVSSGRLSKEEAEDVALQNCQSSGAKKCTVDFTYNNQCVAAVYPVDGAGTTFVTAATVEEAVSRAKSKCEASAKGECRVALSECSDPVFKKY